MSATIRDIAREAQVSTAAVSRVLHGSGGTIRVSKEKAQLIRDLATKLNYIPNAVARNLRQGKSMNIGLVFENFGVISGGPLYYAYLFDGIASVLFEKHYRLTILPEIDHLNGLTELESGHLDGVIWCKFVDDDRVTKMLMRSRIPIVALNSPENLLSKASISVRCDNEHGSELVVDHLWNLGHRKILFVSETQEVQTPDAIARLNGFKDALARRGVEFSSEDLVVWSNECTELIQWWGDKPVHTALYAWNEHVGSNLLRRALNAGIDVPGQLSVVGFDSTSYCETTIPPLTSVNQPIREMAQHAAKILIAMIEDSSTPVHSITFPCTLDVRGSTHQLAQSRVSQS